MSTNDRLLKILQAPPEVQERIDHLLDGAAPAESAVAPSGPLLMGMSEGAKFLGVGRATLWRMIKAGRLEKVELLPGSFRVRRTDLEAVAAGRKTEAGG
jgi:excisionase family DNA binding protein